MIACPLAFPNSSSFLIKSSALNWIFQVNQSIFASFTSSL